MSGIVRQVPDFETRDFRAQYVNTLFVIDGATAEARRWLSNNAHQIRKQFVDSRGQLTASDEVEMAAILSELQRKFDARNDVHSAEARP